MAVLMASGRSDRFGEADKLLAPLGHVPLIYHAADALRECGADRFVVVAGKALATDMPDGFERIDPASPGAGLGDNIAHAARFAVEEGSSCLLIHLADMPLVPAAHLSALIESASDDKPAATLNVDRLQVPACFPRSWLLRLTELSGDRGAGGLFEQENTNAVPLAPDLLADVDTVEDLARLQP